MSMLAVEQINQIRSSVDIVDVVSSYIPLTQKGKNYFGVCPFHDDHAPSMSVSKDKQIYTCFSCGATGNVFKFVMDYENITFPEAISKMANKAGIQVDLNIPNQYIAPVHQELYQIYDLGLKYYQNNIHTEHGQAALQYLHDRNLTDEIIREFQIGLAIKKNDGLTTILTQKKYAQTDLLKSGLVVKNEYGYHDIYYDRIMFPLSDVMGRVVGFSGRVYHGEKEFKYINTKETEIFKKGELLYNYHRAKDACRLENTVIVMEGFMDVIRAFEVGIKNTIATMGTAVTRNQALMIKKMAKNVILCFDGDKAGEKATFACSNELMAIGVVPLIIRLESQMDPDDYIQKHGKEQFIRKLESPMNVMDFKIDYYKNNKDFENSVDVAKYVNDMMAEISKIDDEVLRELTLKKIAEDSHLEIQFLKNQLHAQQMTIPPVVVPKVLKKEVRPLNKYVCAERNLVYYMLRSKEIIQVYNKKVTFMPTERYRFLAREISYFCKTYGTIGEADFLTSIATNEKLMDTMREIVSLDLKEDVSMEEINDYVHVIQDCNLTNESNRLKEQMKKEIDPMKKAEIANKMIDLKVRGEHNAERN